MAGNFLDIIHVRENNDYCYLAMLHGHDMKRNIIKTNNVYEKSVKLSSDQERLHDDFIANMMSRGIHA